ncbi:hypothetical protein [Limobrevibacterium gyesilva]|uniref:hypothetical protein n=1 Tax=Limobrevibacterium gyesilva TaxID=2991712 RepID=UPI0032421102
MDEQERILVRAAKGLAVALPLDGACYRASLFLKLFLEQEHGTAANAVVGFVNDGTDELYASHAWLEFRGQRTDLTLCRPMSPEVQKRGQLVIHGRVIAEGWSRYTYHMHRPLEGLRVIQQMMSNPSTRPMVAEQEELHLRMVATAKNNTLIRAYLDGAPDGLTYDRIATAVKRG